MGFGVEFRAAYTATYQLRFVPDPDHPDWYSAAVILTDCRADAKTLCTVPLGGRKVAGENSDNGDTDWYKVANLRRGRLYTFTVPADVYTDLYVADAKGTILARGHANGGGTGTVRFRPRANGTYFFAVTNGYHYTVSVK